MHALLRRNNKYIKLIATVNNFFDVHSRILSAVFARPQNVTVAIWKDFQKLELVKSYLRANKMIPGKEL